MIVQVSERLEYIIEKQLSDIFSIIKMVENLANKLN